MNEFVFDFFTVDKPECLLTVKSLIYMIIIYFAKIINSGNQKLLYLANSTVLCKQKKKTKKENFSLSNYILLEFLIILFKNLPNFFKTTSTNSNL